MSKKSYKKRYEELLAKTQIDEKISQHTRSYIHIPFSWSGIGRFFALLGSIGLVIANFLLLISVGYTYKVWELLGSSEPQEAYHSFSQLIILYPLIGQYLLIGLAFVCLIALIKGGFKKYEEGGLIAGLIFGLTAGLIVGMTTGLIFCMIFGLTAGLIAGMINGLIVGLSGGLIIGLIIGLIN
jgi:hypothetical protein